MINLLALSGGVAGAMLLLIFGLKWYLDRKAANRRKNNTTGVTSILEKKYPEYDLRKYSGMFFRVGMTFSILMTLLAFSWTTYDKVPELVDNSLLDDELEILPPNTQIKPPPPPPPPQPDLKVLEDEIIIEDEPEFELDEIDFDTEIEIDEIPEPDVVDEGPDFFTIVEDMPEFPGGQEALMRYLGGIKYPDYAKEVGMEDKVFIRFIINEQGEVTDVLTARGEYNVLNQAAERYISNMPKWTPGKQRGKPVKVQFVVPINFVLGN